MRQLRHQRQDGVGFPDAGRVEPGQAARRSRQARPAEALRASCRLFLSPTLAQPEQQRRCRPYEGCQRSVRFEAHTGLGAAGQIQIWRGAGCIGTRALIGARRSGVQRLLDRLPVGIEVGRIGRARYVHWIANREAEVGPRQVQRHAAPAIECDVARRGYRHGQDRASGLPGEHDDAETRLTRLASRNIRGHGHGAALAQRLHRCPVGVRATLVLATRGRAGAADELDPEVTEHRAHQLGIAMSCQHHVGFEAGIFDERQKHELSVPHGDDARVMMRVLFEPLRHSLVLPRGAADESDVTREQRADRGVNELGLGLSVRHSGGTCRLV